MITRQFTMEDQLSFATLSGDYNPLHIDEKLARRLLFGAPVVHGIHLLLWSLNEGLKEKGKENLYISNLKVIFLKPVKVNSQVFLKVKENNEDVFKVELFLEENTVCTTIDIEWGSSSYRENSFLIESDPEKEQCKKNNVDDFDESYSWREKLYVNTSHILLKSQLEEVANKLPSSQIAALLLSTRIVGMKCPGLNSIYTSLKGRFDDGLWQEELDVKIKKVNRKFGKLTLNIEASNIQMEVATFIRPSVISQESYSQIRENCIADEFTGQIAVVVGGSRGLGEITAKILAAGGAEVIITYHRGEEDAKRIVEEVKKGGGKISHAKYNVLDVDFEKNLLSTIKPTHLYYFATPFIFDGAKGNFSVPLFNRFNDYYIKGFISTFNLLKSSNLKAVFYPSSVAIDEFLPDMSEYILAKSSGELLCKFLEETHGIAIYKPRLPRLQTDQTASLTPQKEDNPVPLFLKSMREFSHLKSLS